MFRKSIIYLILSLLVALPVLGLFADQVSAASSRVAVIKEMKGTAKVKKAGGSKEFTAFTKMSLNEGDILTTSGSSSAVLQFANGTSEDDKMTVSSNTTLTFSKLSNSKGTSTKVSMFNGSAWVDVKSITSKDDEFSLETPTVIMGVRGTHLLVSVDPETGATHLTVAAGVVSASSKDSDGTKENQDVYPTQNALFTDDKQGGGSEITVAPVDLELLMKQSDSSIVQAILENAAAIIAENEQYVKQYEDSVVPSNLGGTKDDLARFKSNTENLLGAIADQAVKSGLLSKERLDQIIAEVQNQSGIKVDLTKKSLIITDVEQKQKDDQRHKEDEAKKQAEAQKKQEEEQRKQNNEINKKLEEQRKAKEELNKKTAEEKLKRAQEEYEKQLPAAEKQRFEDAKQQRVAEQQASVTPSPSPSPSQSPSTSPDQESPKSENANLSALTIGYEVSGETSPLLVTPVFNSNSTSYTATVPYYVTQVKVTPIVADTGKASVKVNGNSIVNNTAALALGEAGTSTVINIVVTAENEANKQYKVTLQRDVNHAPTAVNAEVAMNQDEVFDGYLVGYDSDGDILTYWVFEAPQVGTLNLNTNGSYSYTPNPGSYGTFYFKYKVYDGSLYSEAATVAVNIRHVDP